MDSLSTSIICCYFFQAQSDIEWKFGLAKLIRNMHRTNASPAPINLVTTWIQNVQTFLKGKQSMMQKENIHAFTQLPLILKNQNSELKLKDLSITQLLVQIQTMQNLMGPKTTQQQQCSGSNKLDSRCMNFSTVIEGCKILQHVIFELHFTI